MPTQSRGHGTALCQMFKCNRAPVFNGGLPADFGFSLAAPATVSRIEPNLQNHVHPVPGG